METEDKYLVASCLFAVMIGGLIFSSMHHAQAVSPEPGVVVQSLPVGLTRAEVLGKTYRADKSLQRPYVLVEFGDYQCPPCRALYGRLEDLVATRKKEVGLAFRHYPLMEIHTAAFPAALYAEAAREQGKFWQMHDLLYRSADGGLAPESLEQDARSLHLNMTALHKSMETTAKARVRADLSEALALNLAGTPTLLLCEPSGRIRTVSLETLEKTLP